MFDYKSRVIGKSGRRKFTKAVVINSAISAAYGIAESKAIMPIWPIIKPFNYLYHLGLFSLYYASTKLSFRKSGISSSKLRTLSHMGWSGFVLDVAATLTSVISTNNFSPANWVQFEYPALASLGEYILPLIPRYASLGLFAMPTYEISRVYGNDIKKTGLKFYDVSKNLAKGTLNKIIPSCVDRIKNSSLYHKFGRLEDVLYKI